MYRPQRRFFTWMTALAALCCLAPIAFGAHERAPRAPRRLRLPTLRDLSRGALALAVAAALIAAGCGSSNAPTTLNATIDVVNAKPKGGVQDLKVKKNGQVHLTVNSDTADEIHIHGYNFMKDVEKGGSAKFDFKATIDGGFVIELEDHKETLANLAVEP